MLTGRELSERIKKRQAELDRQNGGRRKRDHIEPCEENFDYACISQGSKEGLELILREISGK